jgi:hypothetical protein
MRFRTRVHSKTKMALVFAAIPFLTGAPLWQTTGRSVQGSSSQKSVVLVDTDDDCHLSVDDTDKGVVTPSQSKKVSVPPGEHVVKCVVDGVPDLVWRKVVEVKESTQSAAMVSLKALHIQYNEAAAKAQRLKEEADAKQQQDKQDELQRQEQARRTEDEFPHKMSELIKGRWVTDESVTDTSVPGVETGNIKTGNELTFRQLDSSGAIAFTLNQWSTGSSVGYFSSFTYFSTIYAGTLRPEMPNRLVGDASCAGTTMHPSKAQLKRIGEAEQTKLSQPPEGQTGNNWYSCQEKTKGPYNYTMALVSSNQLDIYYSDGTTHFRRP